MVMHYLINKNKLAETGAYFGLIKNDKLPVDEAIQKAYGDWGGSQCGYWTPGFMMTVKHLLARNPNPTEAEIRNGLSSNLCRCTGYSQMYQAIKAAIEAEQKGSVVAR